jgi:cyclopropane-fatty-acyl-phospholipid synthase
MILHRIADKIIFNILKRDKRRLSRNYLNIWRELLKFGNYEDKLKADLKIKSSASKL